MRHLKARELALAAMFTAVTAVFAQLVVPLGFTPVPFSLAMVALFLCGALLGPRAAFLSQLCYLLVGAAGVPVFSQFGAGLQKLAGPTGGYLAAYPFMALVISLLLEKWGRGFWRTCAAMTVGLALCYTMGTAQLMLLTGSGVGAALMMAVVPFAPFDLVKIVLSAVLAAALRRALRQARLLATLA